MTHPLEEKFQEEYGASELLFRARTSVLVSQSHDEGFGVVRLFEPPDDVDVGALRSALASYLSELKPVDHPALLWPVTGRSEELPLLRYALKGMPRTLPQFVQHKAQGWSLQRLVTKLAALAQAVNKLHKARRVHGAIAPVNVIVERRKGGELAFVLIACGVWKPVQDVMLARRALGAGPAPRRRTPPNFASDVRAFGQMLRWLVAAGLDTSSALEVERVPVDLYHLIGRCARKRPIRMSTVFKELKRITEAWEELDVAEEPPKDKSPFHHRAGAFKSALTEDAEPPVPADHPERDEIELSLEASPIELPEDEDDIMTSGEFRALIEDDEEEDDLLTGEEEEDDLLTGELDEDSELLPDADAPIDDGWDLRTDDIEALIDFDPSGMPTDGPVDPLFDEGGSDGDLDPSLADDPFGFSTSLKRAKGSGRRLRRRGEEGTRLLDELGSRLSMRIPPEILNQLPKYLQTSRMTAFVLLRVGIEGGWGETVLLMHNDQLFAFARSTMFEGSVDPIPLDPQQGLELHRDEEMLLLRAEGDEEHLIDISSCEEDARSALDDVVSQLELLARWDEEEEAAEAFAEGELGFEDDDDEEPIDIPAPPEGPPQRQEGPPGADGVLGRREDEEAEPSEAVDTAPPPPPQDDPTPAPPPSRRKVHVASEAFPDRTVVPQGEIMTAQHTLQPDVMIVSDTLEVPPYLGLKVAVAVAIVVLLVVLVFWSVLTSGAELPGDRGERPAGTHRILIEPPVSLDEHRVFAVDPAGHTFAVCQGSELVVGSVEGERSLIERVTLDTSRCRDLAYAPSGERVYALLDERRWWSLNLVDGTVSSTELPFDGEVLEIAPAGASGVVFRVALDETLTEWRVFQPGWASARRLPGSRFSAPGGERCASHHPTLLALHTGAELSLFDTESGQHIKTLSRAGEIMRCAMSPDSHWAALVIGGLGVEHVRLATGVRQGEPFPSWLELGAGRAPVELAYGADGHALLVGVRDALHLVSPRFGAITASLQIDRFNTAVGDRIRLLPFSTDALLFTEDGVTRLDLEGDRSTELRLHAPSRVHAFSAFSDNGAWAVSFFVTSAIPGMPSSAGGHLVVWDLEALEARHIVPYAGRVAHLSLSPGGAVAAVVIEDVGGGYRLETLRLSDGEVVAERSLRALPRRLQWSLGGAELLVESQHGTSTVFAHGEGHLAELESVDSRYPMAIYRDHALLSWQEGGLRAIDVVSKQRSTVLLSASALGGFHVEGIALHPLQRVVLFYGSDGLFRASLDDLAGTLRRLDATSVDTVQWTRDGSRFFAGGSLFNERGDVLMQIEAPAQRTLLSPRGDRLLVVREDRATLLEAPSGEVLREIADLEARNLLTSQQIFHPGLDLLARSSRGLLTLESASEPRPVLEMAMSHDLSWTLTSPSGFVAPNNASSLLAVSDGFARLELETASRLAGADVVRASLPGTLSVAAPADPLAGTPPIDFPHVVRLSVVSQPAGAEVYRVEAGTESFLGTTPFEEELSVSSGAVDLVLRKPGFLDRRQSLVPQADTRVSVLLVDGITSAEAKLFKVEGPLPRDAVSAQVQSNRRAFAMCNTMDFLSTLERAEARIVVSADGRVSSVEWTSSLNSMVGRCVSSLIESWSFPEAAAPSVVTYSFLFGSYTY